MATQQENVTMVRERYEAFNEQNFDAVIEGFDDDIEWIIPEGFRHGGTYHGPAEVGGFFEEVMADIDDLHIETDRFIDSGETVVVTGTLRGTASETGESVDISFMYVIDLEDDQITRFQE